MKIVLDAGHGRYDKKGAVKGFYEGTNNYDACILLKKELLKYQDVEVVLTRPKLTDNPENPIRGKMGWDADLFYSWHSNGSDSIDATGVSVYHSIAIDDVALAKSVGAAVAMAFPISHFRGAKTRTYPGHDERDYYNVIRNSVLTNGDRLSKTPIRSNCKHSLIVEHGFHSNQFECEFLNSKDGLAKIVKAEAVAIAAYFGLKEKLPVGDINGDGKVNSADAILMKRHIQGLTVLQGEYLARADLNGDGKVNIVDYVMLKRIIQKQK